MDDEMKRFLQEELKRDAEQILCKAESDPDAADVKASPELQEKLFEQIHQYEQKKAKEKTYEELPDEYKELVELGKVYKRKKKAGKYLVLAAVLVLAMAVGVTSFGGTERIFGEFKWKMGGRDQVNVDSDGERVVGAETSHEEEAYQKVKDTFGFEPVRFYYLPDEMKFVESTIDKNLRMAHCIYEGKEDEVLIYQMNVNYKQGSLGVDVEDKLVDEFIISRDETVIEVKQYLIAETSDKRWIVRFEYGGIQYFMSISDLTKTEIKKIVKNLNFF